ncbi:MAG: hypothetical protein WCS30_00065 [Selenomonadaceae bacterium]
MAKTYTTNIAIGGQILSSFVKAMTGVNTQVDKAANNTKKQTSAMNNAFGKIGGTLKTAVAGLAGYISLRGALSMMEDWTSEANNMLQAQAKLEALLKNVVSLQGKGADIYAKTTNELTSYADQLRSIGIIDDDIIVSGMQQLATFQLNGAEIKSLSTGMADLLAQSKGVNATQQDAVQIANLIGKATTGQVGALTRYGIIMNDNQKKAIKFGTQQQKINALTEALAMNVGGVNEALAKTDLGKMKQSENTIAGIKEKLGTMIMPEQANIYKSIADMLTEPEVLQALDYIPKIINGISKAIVFLIQNKDYVAPVLMGITAAIVTMTIAQWAYNAAMYANPMTWIILAIIAAIALLAVGIIAVYKNWEKIKEGIVSGIKGIVDWFKSLGEWFGKLFGKKDATVTVKTKTEGEQIEGLAIGGLVTRPAIKYLGEGGDTEAVVPYNNNPRSQALARAAMIGTGQAPGSGDYYSITFAPNIYSNGEPITDAMKRALDEFERLFDELIRKRVRVGAV